MVFLMHPRQTSMGRRGWQAIEAPQGQFNVIRGLCPRAVRWPSALQPDGVRPSPSFSFCSRTMAPGTFKGGPEVMLENVRKQMIVSGMDENSAEVTTVKGSLAKAKRNAQEAPLCRAGERISRNCRSSSEAFGCSRQIAQRVRDRIGDRPGCSD